MYGRRANLKSCPFCGCELQRDWNSEGVFYKHPNNGCVIWEAWHLKGSKDYRDWNTRRGEDEFEYMINFAKEGDCDISRDQLRCLWAAYCIHYNLNVDTAQYDRDLRKLWDVVAETNPDTGDWHDFDTFDNFMCKYLA